MLISLSFFDSEVDDSGSWAAVSYYCYLTSGSKRPVIARATLNRNFLQIANGDPVMHEKNIYLLMHEVIHSLGFTQFLYQYYLDANGQVLTNHIMNKTVLGSTPSLILNIPFLTAKARSFFGCSSLEGIYMENYGSSGTAGSHFERRHFIFETMSSGTIHGRRMSEFSLGMLEGTGWYVANYSFAEPYWFGQGQGCNFLKGSCDTTSFKFEEFCSGTVRGCAATGRGGGPCSGDTKLDGCRYWYPDIDYDCDNVDGVDYARYPEIQVFGRGAGSKCFSGNLTRFKSSTPSSFCFKFSCVGKGSTSTLQVQIGNTTVTCTNEGTIQVPGYNGLLNCPDPLTFCNTVGKPFCPRNCMGRGKCVNNKCICNAGFTGIDCAMLI